MSKIRMFATPTKEPMTYIEWLRTNGKTEETKCNCKAYTEMLEWLYLNDKQYVSAEAWRKALLRKFRKVLGIK